MAHTNKETHFLGIGGIGMSALAHILLEKGEKVSGLDRQETPLIAQLREKGAKIHIGDDSSLDSATPVVFSTAIQSDHPTLQKANQSYHRSEFLKVLMQDQKPLLVTGTHGKTSTSGLLAWTLIHAGYDPSYAVGGILNGTRQNGGAGKGDYFVAEADESDGSFLNYPGYGGIITNLEREHLDYWQTEQALKEGFQTFAQGIKHPELLLWCADDPNLKALGLPGKSYGWADDADFRLLDVRQTGMEMRMTLAEAGDIQIPLVGKHQALNAVGVWGLARGLGIPELKIREAFASFQGIKRRLEKKGEKKGTVFYDDYAHHPTEVRTLLSSLKKAKAQSQLVAIFQPHRYSRTRDLMEEFASAFQDADQAIITDVYPAGEEPIAGVSGQDLASKIKGGTYVPRTELVAAISKLAQTGTVMVSIGAGDITKLYEEWE